jgi:undecaprenyl-diphosphatase
MAVNYDNEALFAIFVHFASLLALLIYFRELIIRVIVNFFTYLTSKDVAEKQKAKPDFMLAIYLVFASIPVAFIGLFFEDMVTDLFSQLLFIGIGFLITALTLLFVGLFSKHRVNSTYTFKNTIITGLFQCIGILPGISRSGITMSGGRIAGLDNQKSKEFAFLLFIPVAAGSFILSLTDISVALSSGAELFIYYGVAMVAAFVFTYLALVFIFKKFSIKAYKYFAIYMFVIAALTITLSILN